MTKTGFGRAIGPMVAEKETISNWYGSSIRQALITKLTNKEESYGRQSTPMIIKIITQTA